uniref:Fe2OG dioxygenase domain-containing protein n=1 Tax=Fagus sylvatica TaxID=28930 RepID=A0A2N9I0A7_FAGSY
MASLDPAAPSVIELTKEPMTAVPQKYIRPDQERPAFSDGNPLPNVPTIDMKKLVLGEAIDLELEKLHSTCKEWGLFQLVNHGVSSSLLEKLKYEIEEFFKLPLEEKMKYKIRPGDFEGYGTIVRSEDQKLDWGDKFYVIMNPIHRRKPYLFNELTSSLRNTIESYFSELQTLAMTLMGLMGKAFKMEIREMEELFEDGMQSMRMTYYPPCPQPELVVGLTPHSDATGITILHQVNGVGGLQIKKDGVWIPVNFIPNAFVVNVGDTMEVCHPFFSLSIS